MSRRRSASLSLVVLLALGMAGCDDGGADDALDQSAPGQIRITAREYAFGGVGPGPVAAGLEALTLENRGREPHQAQVLRLDQGVDITRLLDTIRRDASAVLSVATAVGGPGAVRPGGRQQTVNDLVSGSYVLACLVPAPDGVPHAAKGMLKPFEVGGAQSGEAEEPATDEEIRLRDFLFTLPTEFSGEGSFKVLNDGPQAHELELLRMAPGRNLDDIAAEVDRAGVAAPPSPAYAEAGGLGIMAPGGIGFIRLRLTPGDYVAVCTVKDPGTGRPHSQLGMVTPFAVR